MNIAFDIDGCIMDYNDFIWIYLPLFCKKHKIPYNPNKNLYYHNCKQFNLTDYQDNLFWAEEGKKYYHNRPPRKYSKNVLDKLHKKNNKIFILTARTNKHINFNKILKKYLGKDFETFTLKYFKKYKLYFDEMHFDCKNKVKKIKALNIDCILEDSPENIQEIYKQTNAIIFMMDNYSNRNIKENDRIIRVFSMTDFYYKFNNFFYNKKV